MKSKVVYLVEPVYNFIYCMCRRNLVDFCLEKVSSQTINTNAYILNMFRSQYIKDNDYDGEKVYEVLLGLQARTVCCTPSQIVSPGLTGIYTTTRR